MKIEFWFDPASTYSYPAAMRMEALATAQGIELEWRAFLLGPIFRAQGWTDAPANLFPAKGRNMWRDLERTCAGQGILFRRPSRFPANSMLAARIACRFGAEAWLPAFVRGLYRAQFGEDQDIASPATIAACLQLLGIDAAMVLEQAQTPEAKDALRAQTDEAMRRGIFGAPSFIVGDELFWGNDRLEQALAWARNPGIVASSDLT